MNEVFIEFFKKENSQRDARHSATKERINFFPVQMFPQLYKEDNSYTESNEGNQRDYGFDIEKNSKQR